jgi:hypothetical protein
MWVVKWCVIFKVCRRDFACQMRREDQSHFKRIEVQFEWCVVVPMLFTFMLWNNPCIVERWIRSWDNSVSVQSREWVKEQWWIAHFVQVSEENWEMCCISRNFRSSLFEEFHWLAAICCWRTLLQSCKLLSLGGQWAINQSGQFQERLIHATFYNNNTMQFWHCMSGSNL